MFTTYGLHGSKPYIAYDLDAVIYTDIKRVPCIATNESIFDFWTEYTYAEREGINLLQVPIGYRYSIDNIEVTEQTFNDVRRLLSERNLVKKYESVRKKENEDMIKVIEKVNATDSIVTFSNGNSYKPVKFYFEGNPFTPINNLTITNYKYNPETKTTTIWWSDNSQTSVTADPDTEANEFTGFCAACAKKLFGNKSTYLNQFDKWAIKKPEQERKKAEVEKVKAEEQAKINAEKAERAKERKIKRLAKKWANDYKTANERLEIYEAAEKLAKDKYGVPNEYFDNDCDCHCNCKEFDVMDEDENNISD